jgi:outer membrane protein assembly factor BamB
MAVMCIQDNRTGTTKLQVLDAKGDVKHTITSINYPQHASMARRDRVLVCDQNNARVVEVDLAGKVIWSKIVNNPLAIHPLRNGKSFVTLRNQLLILDRTQKELLKIDRAGYDVVAARGFDDGTVSLLTTAGQLIRFGKDGKQTGSVSLAMGGGIGVRRGFLIGTHPFFSRDGGVIVPDYFNSRVRAFGKDGKQKWESNVANPWSVSQITGGNLIVSTRSGNQLIELDRNGKEKKKKTVEGGIPLFYDRR